MNDVTYLLLLSVQADIMIRSYIIFNNTICELTPLLMEVSDAKGTAKSLSTIIKINYWKQILNNNGLVIVPTHLHALHFSLKGSH